MGETTTTRTTAATRNPEATRKRILSAALAEFAAKGISGARVDRIATRSKTNKRMLYHYFGSKAGLFKAVLHQRLGGGAPTLVEAGLDESERMARVGDLLRHAADTDLAAVRMIEAIKDRHQGRFAGAIFADDSVHAAAPDAQVDVAVGVHRTEVFVDLDQFDRKISVSSGPGGPLRIHLTLWTGRSHRR